MLGSDVEADKSTNGTYRLLVENANEAIFVIQEDKVQFANRMTCLLFERAEAEIVGCGVRGRLLPEDWEQIEVPHPLSAPHTSRKPARTTCVTAQWAQQVDRAEHGTHLLAG